MNWEETIPEDTQCLGIVGLGTRGEAARQWAHAHNVRVLLCDPPKAFDQAEEISETFFNLWGNGMGGCEQTGGGMETFVPLEALAAADAIVVTVPLTEQPPFPTRALITADFLKPLPEKTRVFVQSPREVVAPDIQNNPRITFVP